MARTELTHAAIWHSRPTIGLLALSAGLLGQWFRHAAFPAAEAILGHYYGGLIALGLLGATLVWRGLQEVEIAATWKGYLGGLFIWVGWFEFGFHYFADLFRVPPFQASPRLVSSPDLNMVLARFPIVLGIFVLFGLFTRQTKCNMMRWIHRNPRLSPGLPVPGAQRSNARITAVETVFVIRFCYALWLFITYFGASMPILIGAYGLWATWFVCLLNRLLRIPSAGYAFRYGIPVGIIGWVLIATPSHMGLIPVVWLHPFEFPISSLTALAAFVGVILLFARQPGPQRQPAPE